MAAVKGSRFITHNLKLGNASAALGNFFASGVLALGRKTGPFLWQLPATYGYRRDRVDEFLAMLPRSSREAERVARQHAHRLRDPLCEAASPVKYQHAMEVRHPSYFVPEFYRLLERHGVGFVVRHRRPLPVRRHGPHGAGARGLLWRTHRVRSARRKRGRDRAEARPHGAARPGARAFPCRGDTQGQIGTPLAVRPLGKRPNGQSDQKKAWQSWAMNDRLSPHNGRARLCPPPSPLIRMPMSTFRRNASLVSLGIALMAGSAQAQLGARAGSAPLSAGSTAAEVSLDGNFTGSLLRFGEANKAWKFGAEINVGRVSVPGIDPVTGNDITVSKTSFNLGGSVGRREYKVATGAFRPFMGYGASLGFFDDGLTSGFGLGPYFEMGGAYFVTDRFSVGAASTADLQIENSSPEGGKSSTNFSLTGRLISMMATVYF